MAQSSIAVLQGPPRSSSGSLIELNSLPFPLSLPHLPPSSANEKMRRRRGLCRSTNADGDRECRAAISGSHRRCTHSTWRSRLKALDEQKAAQQDHDVLAQQQLSVARVFDASRISASCGFLILLRTDCARLNSPLPHTPAAISKGLGIRKVGHRATVQSVSRKLPSFISSSGPIKPAGMGEGVSPWATSATVVHRRISTITSCGILEKKWS